LAKPIERTQLTISALTVGKVAPEIVGKDLQGVTLRLSSYRGKVVVLSFSAEWCGICRTIFPYERFMLDAYKNWPFAILGIETGADPATNRRVKVDERLSFPSWWDASDADDGSTGPISTAWGIAGFPAVYVLDTRGVIRFVNPRDEDLLKGVRQLLNDDPAGK